MNNSHWIFNPNLRPQCANCGVYCKTDESTPYCPYCGSYMKNYLQEICSSYVVQFGKGVCFGTKECEECSCGGDKRKCNFYNKERTLNG